MTLVDALADRLSSVTDRRGFLGRVAMWGAAVVTAPTVFLLTPTTAYATVCRCAGQACHCSDPCCGGYTEFCCTLTGENACPPGGILGGWWKVDRSSFCGGHARYYMDCHLPCGDCSCGGSGICRGSCNGTPCECGNGDCGNRKTGCLHFRYGNCNNDVRCLGPILCRVVSCTHPWEIDPGCTKVSRTDNRTRYHDSPCLHTDIDPVGALESATTVPHSITVGGWAFDVDADGPVGIRVYVDGELATETPTDVARDDVRRVYGTRTDLVGFQITVPAAPGTRRVCVYAVNLAGGRNRKLGCATLEVGDGAPQGILEAVEPAGEGLRVRGWAFDPSDPENMGELEVQVYAGSRLLSKFIARRSRPDVRHAFALPTDLVGFDEVTPAIEGTVTICVYATDRGDDNRDRRIGCRTLTLERGPVGSVDPTRLVDGGVRVRGWAYDPDTLNPVTVRIYADDILVWSGPANAHRSDVAELFAVGPNHGFHTTIDPPPGTETIRVFAFNSGPGSDTLVGMQEL